MTIGQSGGANGFRNTLHERRCVRQPLGYEPPTVADELLTGLLTTKQIARMWRVVPMTIQNWRRRGCPSVVIPGDRRAAVRWRLEDVVEWHKRKKHHIPKWVLGQVTRARAGG